MNEGVFWALVSLIIIFAGLIVYLILKYRWRWKVILLKDYANPTARTRSWVGTYDPRYDKFIIYANNWFYLFLPFKKIGEIPKCKPENFGMEKILFIVRNVSGHPSENAYTPVNVWDLYTKEENKLEKTNVLLKTQLDAATLIVQHVNERKQGLLSFFAKYPWLLPMMLMTLAVGLSMVFYWYGFTDMMTKLTTQASQSIVNATRQALNMISQRGW